MDKIDKVILNKIQSSFPMVSRPYLEIAKEFGLSEDEVINRVANLKQTGIIRRIGGNFFPKKLGFVSTLCAAKVPEDKIAYFAEIVNSYAGVTHNYQRNNECYNIWFTFIAQSMQEIKENLCEIAQKTGVSEIINLPATKLFKVKAHFDL